MASEIVFRTSMLYYWRSIFISSLLVCGAVAVAIVPLVEIAGGQLEGWRWLGVGGFLLVAGSVAARVFFFRYSARYTISDTSVSECHGLIARNINELKLDHVRAYDIRQGPIERLLNLGTLVLSSAGDVGSVVRFLGIRAPNAAKKEIEARTLSMARGP